MAYKNTESMSVLIGDLAELEARFAAPTQGEVAMACARAIHAVVAAAQYGLLRELEPGGAKLLSAIGVGDPYPRTGEFGKPAAQLRDHLRQVLARPQPPRSFNVLARTIALACDFIPGAGRVIFFDDDVSYEDRVRTLAPVVRELLEDGPLSTERAEETIVACARATGFHRPSRLFDAEHKRRTRRAPRNRVRTKR